MDWTVFHKRVFFGIELGMYVASMFVGNALSHTATGFSAMGRLSRRAADILSRSVSHAVTNTIKAGIAAIDRIMSAKINRSRMAMALAALTVIG